MASLRLNAHARIFLHFSFESRDSVSALYSRFLRRAATAPTGVCACGVSVWDWGLPGAAGGRRAGGLGLGVSFFDFS